MSLIEAKTSFSYKGPFEEKLLIVTTFEEDEIPPEIWDIIEVADAGKLCKTMFRPASDAWERLCALEEDLLRVSDRSEKYDFSNWYFVCGEAVNLDGVRGWLENDELIVVTLPKDQEEDILIMRANEFETLFTAFSRARVPIADDSGLKLNRALKEVEALEKQIAEIIDDLFQ